MSDTWLTTGINKIMIEEDERIGLRIKVVEENGTSLGFLLTCPDLSRSLFPDCCTHNPGTTSSAGSSSTAATSTFTCDGTKLILFLTL